MNRTISHCACVLALLCAGVAMAAEPPAAPPASRTYFDEDPAKWASPKVVLPPTYPPDALAKGVTAVVEARVKLTATGRLEAIVETASEPKLDAFEAAVREVLKHWTFEQSFDDDCRPVAAEGRLKVWFEIKEGKPTISVTHMPAAPRSDRVGLKNLNRPEVIEALQARYPRQARLDGEQAIVYARLSVDPASGATQDVKIVTLSGHPRIFKKQSGSAKLSGEPTIAMLFAGAAATGLKVARFDPESVKASGHVEVCMSVDFRLSPVGADEKDDD